MPPLVSVIIPCFNAERWVAEAIESCLQQIYPNIEIIVIDDGSTDNSLKIIKRFEKKITWERLPHKGGNSARNRGFAISKGKYIQFLDADDCILPEKIQRQVSFLEATGADVVYGDWRHKHHLSDGTSFLDKVEISGTQVDIIESLLANWWTAVASLLYRRSAVEKTAGWDERLQAAQDRDFFVSVAMNNAKVVYQPGCYSIYRRYGNVTVSSSSTSRWIESHCTVLEKAEKKLKQMNKLTMKYRYALAKSYFELARESLLIDNYLQYLHLLEKTLILFPDFKRNSQIKLYDIIQSVCGFRHTERIACRILLLRKSFNSIVDSFVNPKKKYKTTH